MEPIIFDETEGTVFFTLVNSDLTEGRGVSVVHSVHLSEDAAEAAAYKADVMGSDGTTKAVPTGQGAPDKPVFTLPSSTTLFGYAGMPTHYAGPRYTRLADLPDFTDDEWDKFQQLALIAGRNPLKEVDQKRRERIRASKERLREAEQSAPPLFAVVTDDKRDSGRISSPLIVAVLDTAGDAKKAGEQFVTALSKNAAELRSYRVVELFPGRPRDRMFGATIDLPEVAGLAVEILRANPDGTVFFVPGEAEQYTLRGGILYTVDGYEADIDGLVKGGLRVCTQADRADIAFTKMEQMLARR